jgi:TonB family protein
MRCCLCLFALLCCTNSLAAQPLPHLRSAPIPFYPAIARTARIQGTVTLTTTINELGDTCDIVATSGHPLLKEAAIQNLKEWKFEWSGPCPCRATKEVTLVYKLSGNVETSDSPAVTIRWFGRSWGGTSKVEIEADEPGLDVESAH